MSALPPPPQPVALIHGTQGRFLDDKQNSVEANIDYSCRVRGHHVGPMPFPLLKAAFLEDVEVRRPAPRVDWTKVPNVRLEVHMYDLFVQAMLDCGLLRQNTEIFVSADRHSSTSHLRPDIGIRILPEGITSRQWSNRKLLPREPFEFTTEALAIEMKLPLFADPFLDDFDHPRTPFEREGNIPRKSRGQLAKYADVQLSQQHRRFAWQVVICANIARILRWDRAGVLVSEGFDYIETNYLAEFLWRFFHMTPAQQGWDDSVEMVEGPDEANRLYDAIDRFITQALDKTVRSAQSFASIALDKNYPVHKVAVRDCQKHETRYFLVGRAFYATRGPIGRMTRVYLAYDLETKSVKLLKDSWAMDDENLISEVDAYRALKAASVPSILPITCGGDVGLGGAVQRTEIQAFATKSYPWRAPCGSSFRTLRHCRLVQDLAYPVDCLKNSREATIVFRDVAKCIKSAYEDAKILHRDVSLSNILFVLTEAVPGIVGILNDWDHSTKADGTVDYLLPFRSASVQCMSIALLKNPRKVHTLADDMESLFWALVYLALHFVAHSDENVLDNNSVFGPGRERVFSGEVTKNDASGKTGLLMDDTLNDFPFRCEPFKRLISEFALCLHSVYSLEHLARSNKPGARRLYEEAKQQAADPDWWISLFEEALTEDNWLDDDMVEDMFPPRSSVETQNEVDAFATTLYDSSHITATKVHTLPPDSMLRGTKTPQDEKTSQIERTPQDNKAGLEIKPLQDSKTPHPAAPPTSAVKRPLEQPRNAPESPRAALTGRKKRRHAKENDTSGPTDAL